MGMRLGASGMYLKRIGMDSRNWSGGRMGWQGTPGMIAEPGPG